MRFLIFSLIVILWGPSCSVLTEIPKYDRDQWGGWKQEKCMPRNHQILKTRSVIAPQMDERGCRVKEGKWTDFYTGETLTMKDHPTLDHIVPVKLAHEGGGHRWSYEKRRNFYNDPKNLVITSKSMNSQKGAKSFVDWSPASRERACQYAGKWIYVKNKYGLKYSKQECLNFKALEESKPCPQPLGKVKGC